MLVADSSGGGLSSLGELVRIAMHEASNDRVGGQSVLGRLTELMFMEVVRGHVEALSGDRTSWLCGLRDPFVGRSLSLIHSAPGRLWSVDTLARQTGLSRSEFAERFACFVGIPPMHYLAKWRMQVAAGMLSDGVNIASIAPQVGYGSEASFSRAFKKIVGISPSLWRNREDLLEAA